LLFFFQEEDGILDFHVTGVQTCALPIWVLKTKPLNIVSGRDPSSGGIAHWKHGALHDIVQPMADHVIMTYIDTMQPLERRAGRKDRKSVVEGERGDMEG